MPVIPKTFSEQKRFDKNPNDLFITPIDLAVKCIEELEFVSRYTISHNNPTVLDVGCGTGVWGNAVRKVIVHSQMVGVDIKTHGTITEITPYPYDNFYHCDYLNYDSTKQFDLIIGNPPFSSKSNKHLAEDIVLHSLDLLTPNGYLGLLLKTEFVASTRRYENIFKNHAPLYQYSIYPRPYFNDLKGSNTIEYSFFIWDKNKNDETKLRWLSWKE